MIIQVQQGQRVFVDVTFQNIGTSQGNAYIRATLVGTSNYDLINTSSGTKDGNTGTLNPVQSSTISFYLDIPSNAPLGLYGSSVIARTQANLGGEVLDEVWEATQVEIVEPVIYYQLKICTTRVDGTPDRETLITIGGTSGISDSLGCQVGGFSSGSRVKVRVDGHGNMLIFPTLTTFIEFFVDMDSNKTYNITLGTQEEWDALHPEPLPPDNDGITGVTHTVEFGLLDPPQPLGNPGETSSLNIVNKRTFTLAEVSRTDAEILAVRVNYTGPYRNTIPLDHDWKLLRPDGSTIVTPENPNEIVPVLPSDSWYNWSKHAAVWNGVGGDLIDKGRYKITILVDGGNPPSGFYELYFEVI